MRTPRLTIAVLSAASAVAAGWFTGVALVGDRRQPVAVTGSLPASASAPLRVASSETEPVASASALKAAALALRIQSELKRVGCLAGEPKGTWTSDVRRAMDAFQASVSARLPTEKPDHLLLTLVRGHASTACVVPCDGPSAGSPDACRPLIVRRDDDAEPAVVAQAALAPERAAAQPVAVRTALASTSDALTPPAVAPARQRLTPRVSGSSARADARPQAVAVKTDAETIAPSASTPAAAAKHKVQVAARASPRGEAKVVSKSEVITLSAATTQLGLKIGPPPKPVTLKSPTLAQGDMQRALFSRMMIQGH